MYYKLYHCPKIYKSEVKSQINKLLKDDIIEERHPLFG